MARKATGPGSLRLHGLNGVGAAFPSPLKLRGDRGGLCPFLRASWERLSAANASPGGRLAKLQILDGMLNPEALLAAMKIYQGLWLDLKPKA